jgi:hypothetical protein
MLRGMHKDWGVEKCKKALMDDSLARAFLTVGSFKHGVRSMEAILRMSHFTPDETMMPSCLPVKEQLGLHVDWREFFDAMENKSATVLGGPAA